MSDTRTARKAEIRARQEFFIAHQDGSCEIRLQIAGDLVLVDLPWLLDELDAARRTALLEAAEILRELAERLSNLSEKIPTGWSHISDESEALYDKAVELRRRAEEKS